MIFLLLFITFFEIGLFGFGGGYAMLSMIQSEVVVRHQWLTSAEFTNIVAISQMTPGPIGINTATYCGFTAVHNAGYGEVVSILGSLMSTAALMLPSVVLMIIISKMLMKYMQTKTVQYLFLGLRPAVVGLLAAATLLLLNAENFSTPADPWYFYISVCICIASFIGTYYIKINPLKMIAMAAFAGLLLLW